MSDDWNDRLRSSNDYLDRRQDQVDFETAQRKRAGAVTDAIRNHDDLGARLALGIPAPDPSDAGDESASPPTLQELFDDCRTNLRCLFHMSEVLSEPAAETLIDKLRTIDLAEPLPAVEAFREFRGMVERAMDLAPRREQEEAARELGVLDQIVSHVFNQALERGIRNGLS